MRPEQTLRFAEFEEAIFHLERGTGPWNIQVEIGARGQLDEERMRAAVATACARHPIARARLRHWEGADRAYQWFIPDHLDVDPVSVADCPDAAALAAARTAFYSPPIELDIAPPLRVMLARRPAGDLVCFTLSHIPFDGVGSVPFIQSVAYAYRGEEEPADAVPFGQARVLDLHLAPTGLKEVTGRAIEGLRRVREALDAPSRVAAVGGSDAVGFGFLTRRLDADATGALLASRPKGSTLNDLLVAALHLTIDRWNAEHGQRSGRIGLMMPVNTRPKDWFWDTVANYASFFTVSTDARDRTDLPTATRAVTAQTDAVIRAQRASGLFDLIKLGRNVPVGVKRMLPSLLPLTGNRFVDTSVLSNLGRIPDPPRFEDEPAPEVWFTPPCPMPVGSSIGVATAGGALHLGFRHELSQFGKAEAEQHADLYVTTLGA